MRYVQINSFYNGSTGTIMRKLHRELIELGVDSYIFWGRRHATINIHEQRCASTLGVYIHGIRTRLFGKAGFYSKADTRKLLAKLDEIKPDVVHLHNVHGYYMNVQMLFSWLADHKEVQVKWTLHDCWAFTGHCAHFSYTGCQRWKNGTCDTRCPQLGEYPRTMSRRSCAWNIEHKRMCFTQLPVEQMTLISPSHWLEKLVKQSFLSKYPVVVCHNTIDKTVFKPSMSDFRKRYGIGNKIMILGVASPWTERKGLEDFVRLFKMLEPERYVVVLVGLTPRQANTMPDGIIALGHTKSPKELAAIYTAADLFFNPTREDNFPTVNLEAEACGTPVITYDTGGCAETIHMNSSILVKDKRVESVAAIVERMYKAPACNAVSIFEVEVGGGYELC